MFPEARSAYDCARGPRGSSPPPRVFWEKRLQAIENKGNESRKERKETTKRRQAIADKRVDTLKARKFVAGNALG